MSDKNLKDLARFGGMILLGPISLLSAIKADFYIPGDQLLAGIVGTFLWFMVLAEVMLYV